MLAENADRDRFLDADVVALSRLGDPSILAEMAASPAPSLRRGGARDAAERDPSRATPLRRGSPDQGRGVEGGARSPHRGCDAAARDDRRGVPPAERGGRRGDARRRARGVPDRPGSRTGGPHVARGVRGRPRRDRGAADVRGSERRWGSLPVATDDHPGRAADRLTDSRSRATTRRSSELSRTGAADDLEEIARVDGYVGLRRWSDLPSRDQRADRPRRGPEILLEARHAEGGGGDHVAVAWLLPDGTFEGPIGAPADLHPSAIPSWSRRRCQPSRRDPGGSRSTGGDGHERDAADGDPGRSDAGGRRVRRSGSAIECSGSGGPSRVARAFRGDPVRARSDAPGSLERCGSIDPHAGPRDGGETRGRPRSRPASRTVFDDAAGDEDRASCLVQLAGLGDPEVPRAIEVLLASESPRLRTAARRAMESTDLDGAARVPSRRPRSRHRSGTAVLHARPRPHRPAGGSYEARGGAGIGS